MKGGSRVKKRILYRQNVVERVYNKSTCIVMTCIIMIFVVSCIFGGSKTIIIIELCNCLPIIVHCTATVYS